MPPSAEALRRELRSVRRFLVVGACNTAVTWALLAVLARYVDSRLAYTVVFVIGLAFTTVATGRYVFAGAARSPRRTMMFVAWYVMVYVLGLLVVGALARRGLPPEIIALGAVAVTAPGGFLGGRLVFRPPPARRPDPSTPPEDTHAPVRP